jgi:UDP-N-acetylglucosamine 2-epimerase (non-hydrolysing)
VAAIRPDWVLVQGDTTTTLCGALAAFYEGVAVAHVEAGLRTGDDRSPFPEEANRRLVARLASLHLCPTTRSAANLLMEAVPEEQVLVTGNTVIDALVVGGYRPACFALRCRGRTRAASCSPHRRESHGEAMRSVCTAVRALAGRGHEVVFPVTGARRVGRRIARARRRRRRAHASR